MKFAGQIIFIWIVSIAIISQFANAASFDLDLKLLQTPSTCPTVLKDTPPLDKSVVPLYIRNQLDKSDTYSLSLSLPSGWSGFIQPEMFVPPMETRQLEAIWITVPDVQPGTYAISVSALSGVTRETVTKTFNVNVLSCRGVTVVISESQKDICSEKKEPVAYAAEVKNIGKVSETFDLFVTKGGQAVSYTTINTPAITLNAGESKIIAVSLTPPKDIVGKQEFVLSARSRATLATTSSPFSLTLRDCYSFVADVQPTTAKLCLGSSANFTLGLSNLGLEDTYSVESDQAFAKAEKASLTLGSGQKDQMKIFVTPLSTGKQTFSIRITPLSSLSDRKTVNLNIDVDECRGIVVVMSPVQSTVCSSTAITYDVIVKNIGAVEETVDITADLGTLEKSQLSLKPKEAKSVKLSVKADFVGDKIVNVAAKADRITDKTISLLTAENCFASGLSVVPEKTETCACDTAEIGLVVSNNGKVADEYDVEISGVGIKKGVKVEAGKSETLKYPVAVPCSAKAETRTLEASAVSKNAKASAKGSLVIRDTAACYSSSVLPSSPAAANIEALKSLALPVKIKNTGLKKNTFSISVEGPQWLYLGTKALSLDSGQEATIYLYASPPYGVSPASYPAKIIAKSEYSESSADIKLNVAAPGAAPSPQATPTTTVTPAPSPSPQPAPTATPTAPPAPSPTLKPAAEKIEIKFVNHMQAGMPEQDVFIETNETKKGQVMRPDVNDSKKAENLAKTAYATATATAHDPFSLGKKPLGPFAKGKSLDFTLGEWLAAAGSGTYTATEGSAEMILSFQKLVPNGTYTAWCSRITFPPNARIVDKPCGASDGSENRFKADANGNGAFSLKLKPLEKSTKETASALAIAYHSDGRTYGSYPGVFGLNSHVQLFFMIPEAAAPAPAETPKATASPAPKPTATSSPAPAPKETATATPSPAAGPENVSSLPKPAKNVSFNATINETGKIIRQDSLKAIAIGIIAFLIVAVLVVRFLTLTK